MIIGINGAKGAGKDTVGSRLVTEHGFVRVGFADALKASAAACFYNLDPNVWDELKNDSDAYVAILKNGEVPITYVTVREFLQFYGTEAHRDIFDPDFWVNHAMKQIAQLAEAGVDVVITDMRFPNEIDAIQEVDGYTWKVERASLESGDGHVSEAKMDDALFDAFIPNDGTIDELNTKVDELVESFKIENWKEGRGWTISRTPCAWEDLASR